MPSWEDAKRLAKNDKGEVQALIGNEWVPVDKVARNKFGSTKVIRRPDAPWSDVIGKGMMRGWDKAASALPFAAGGIASAVGATDTADKLFSEYDKLQALAESRQPKGAQSTAKRVAGELSEVVPAALGPAGLTAYGVEKAAGKGKELGAAGLPADVVRDVGALEGMKQGAMLGVPIPGLKGLSFGKGAREVAKAGATMAGVGAVGDIGQKGIMSDPAAGAAANKLSEKVNPLDPATVGMNVAAGSLASLLGGAFGKIPQLAGAARKRFSTPKSRPAVAPARVEPSATPPAAPEAPTAPIAPLAPTGDAELDEVAAMLGGGGTVPVPQPKARPEPAPARGPKETEAQRRARETAAWEAALPEDATDLTNLGGTKAPKAPRAPVALPPHMGRTLPSDRDYGGAGVRYANDVDRAAYFISHPEYDIRSERSAQKMPKERAGILGQEPTMATADIRDEYLKFVMDATGMTEEEARAYGEKVRTYVHSHRETGKEQVIDVPDQRRPAAAPKPAKPAPKPTKAAYPFEKLAPPKLTDLISELRAMGESVSVVSRMRPGLVRRGWLTPDKLVEWMRENGWLLDHEIAEADRNLPGGSHELAFQRLREGMAGEAIHPEELASAREFAEWEASVAQAESELRELIGRNQASFEKVAAKIEESVKSGHVPLSKGRDALEALEGRLRQANDAAVQGYMPRLPKDVVKKVVAGAMIGSATGQALAADGSGDDSSWAAWAAIGAGAGLLGWGTLKEVLSNPRNTQLFKDTLGKAIEDVRPRTVYEIVNKLEAQMARRTVAILSGVAKGRTLAKDASLKEWLERAVPAQHHKAAQAWNTLMAAAGRPIAELKWKQPVAGMSRDFSPKVGALRSVWDMRDPTTLAQYEAFKANGDPKVEFPEFQFDRGDAAIRAGLAKGMKLVSDDPWTVFANFAYEAASQERMARLMVELRKATLPNGDPVLVLREHAGQGKAAGKYVDIGRGWGGNLDDLRGYQVHRDVVPSMKMSIDTYEPGMATRAIQALTYAVKRSNVFGSAFHLKSLAEGGVNNATSLLLAGDGPAAVRSLNVAKGLESLRKMHAFQLPDGRDALQIGFENGLKIGAPLEDAMGRKDSLAFVDFLGRVIDRLVPSAGSKGAKLVKWYDTKVNQATWDIVHAGLKAQMYLAHFEHEMVTHPGKDFDQIAREVAKYVNFIEGGIDWRRMGEEFQSAIGRNVAGALFSGRGKAMQGIALFAPDWLWSTTKAWTGATPNVARAISEKSAKNLYTSENARYLRQVVAGAIMTAAMANAWQYAATGHGTLRNRPRVPKGEKPTWIDYVDAWSEVQFADGTHMNPAKHYKDFFSVLKDPAQEMAYKLGVVPSEVWAQVSNRQWPVTGEHYAPPITYASPYGGHALDWLTDRGAHAAGRALPFFAQTMNQPFSADSLTRGASGVLGWPIRGYSPGELSKLREKERLKKQAERR